MVKFTFSKGNFFFFSKTKIQQTKLPFRFYKVNTFLRTDDKILGESKNCTVGHGCGSVFLRTQYNKNKLIMWSDINVHWFVCDLQYIHHSHNKSVISANVSNNHNSSVQWMYVAFMICCVNDKDQECSFPRRLFSN